MYFFTMTISGKKLALCQIKTDKGSVYHLNHMETVNDKLSVWENLTHNITVVAVEVHTYCSDSLSNYFRELQKVFNNSVFEAIL